MTRFADRYLLPRHAGHENLPILDADVVRAVARARWYGDYLASVRISRPRWRRRHLRFQDRDELFFCLFVEIDQIEAAFEQLKPQLCCAFGHCAPDLGKRSKSPAMIGSIAGGSPPPLRYNQRRAPVDRRLIKRRRAKVAGLHEASRSRVDETRVGRRFRERLPGTLFLLREIRNLPFAVR